MILDPALELSIVATSTHSDNSSSIEAQLLYPWLSWTPSLRICVREQTTWDLIFPFIFVGTSFFFPLPLRIDPRAFLSTCYIGFLSFNDFNILLSLCVYVLCRSFLWYNKEYLSLIFFWYQYSHSCSRFSVIRVTLTSPVNVFVFLHFDLYICSKIFHL